MTEVNLEGLKIKSSQVYYPKLNLIMPYITDSFRSLDNQRLRRNVGICLNFQIDSPILVSRRIEEMSSHNYAYEFPPRVNVGIDDLDKPGASSITFIGGIPCLIERYRKSYRSVKEPYPTKPFDYSNAVYDGIEQTRLFQRQVIPVRVAELKTVQNKLDKVTNEIINATNLQSFKSKTPQEQNTVLREIELKQKEAKVLGDEINYRSRHLYDGLNPVAYGIETNATNSLYQKYYLKKFSFDYCIYTGWKIEQQMDVRNEGLTALNNPMANNFQLWSKTKTKLFGEIKFLHYRNMGQLYLGPLRVDPSDIEKEINLLKREIHFAWRSYDSEIKTNNLIRINEALIKHANDFAAKHNAAVKANEDAKKEAEANGEPYEEAALPKPTPFDISSVPQDIPTVGEFTKRFKSKYFRNTSFSRWAFIYDIKTFYFQHRVDSNFRGWRFFVDESFSIESPKRYEKYVEFPAKQPLPLYYSVNFIRGFKVGFISNPIVNGKQTTKIDWIDPDNKNDLEPLSNKMIIQATDRNNGFYQIIIVDPNTIENAEDFEDIKVNVSLRFPLDFPVVDIRFHHEPTTILKLEPEENVGNINRDNFSNDDAREELPVSARGLYPQEVENDLPPNNIVYEIDNIVASEVFGIKPGQKPSPTDWVFNP